MMYNEFLTWLQEEHQISERSARDVVSRSKRVLAITGQEKFDSKTLDLLTRAVEFIECTTSIKSQLKRSVKLYEEFLKF